MRNAKLILVLLLVIAFLPYLYACFYALPFADDFCFGWTASQKTSSLQKFLNQYLYWNGRYTSDVLVNFHPLTTGSLLQYQLVSLFSILATPCVFFVFIRQLVNQVMPAIITSLFISLFYLCYLPNITEGVYWYIGLVNYHWGNLCFILQLIVLIRLLKGENYNLIFSAISLLLLIPAIGFNEIAAAIIPVYYFAMLIFLKFIPSSGTNSVLNYRILIMHFIVAFIASAFVICSPGNYIRISAFSGQFNIIYSTWFAIMQTARFIGHWVSSIPFIALSLVVMVNADKVNCCQIKKINTGIWFVLLLFTVFMGAFIPYMATGMLGQHRTMNYVFPFFILLWLCALLSLSAHYQLTEDRTPETSGIRVYILTLIALGIMTITGNGGKIFREIPEGIFSSYKSEFLRRQAQIIQQPFAPIPPLKNIPASFRVVDVKADTTWWVDKCMKRFYTETSTVLH